MYAPPEQNPALNPGAIVNPAPSPFMGERGQMSPDILQLLLMLHRLGGQEPNPLGHTPGPGFRPEHGPGAQQPNPLQTLMERMSPRGGAPEGRGMGRFGKPESGPMQNFIRAHGVVNALQRLRMLRPIDQNRGFPVNGVQDAPTGGHGHGPVY